ncbi:MAG TPA: hypothetical protein VGG25_02500 [Streptosporangiaceae bacterium]|jgi:hypothetical protein
MGFSPLADVLLFAVMKRALAFTLPALAIIAGAVLYGLASAPGGRPQAASRSPIFRLHDAGSTNTPAWTLTVYPDGSGALRYSRPASGIADRNFPASAFHAAALADALRPLRSARLPRCSAAEATAPVELDMGSVSFGSSATLYYADQAITSFCLDNPAETSITRQLNRAVTTALASAAG